MQIKLTPPQAIEGPAPPRADRVNQRRTHPEIELTKRKEESEKEWRKQVRENDKNEKEKEDQLEKQKLLSQH